MRRAEFQNAAMGQIRYRDWFLQEWMAVRGKKPIDMKKELGHAKNTFSKLVNGDQPYRKDYVNQLAEWLDIEPYELLLPPTEALAIREFRESAAHIASVDTALRKVK